jgi:hypothetical protein
MEPIAAFLAQITVGDLILAFVATTLIAECAIVVLPDRIAGPGGWLIDTTGRD